MTFIDWIRGLVEHLKNGGEFTDEMVEALENRQDMLSEVYDRYEAQVPTETTQLLRELMLEAVQLIHSGLEDLLEYSDHPEEELLITGQARVEEGNDVFDSVCYALRQDTSWTSSAALG